MLDTVKTLISDTQAFVSSVTIEDQMPDDKRTFLKEEVQQLKQYVQQKFKMFAASSPKFGVQTGHQPFSQVSS